MAISKKSKNLRMYLPRPLPTPKEIERLTAEIRASWTERTKQRRRRITPQQVHDNKRWTPPVYVLAKLLHPNGRQFLQPSDLRD